MQCRPLAILEKVLFFSLFSLLSSPKRVQASCPGSVCRSESVPHSSVGSGREAQLEMLSHKAEKQAQCCADTASLGHMADENGATGLLHACGPFSGGSNRFKLQQPLRATCASTLCSYQMMKLQLAHRASAV